MSYNESLRSDSNYPPMTQSQWDNAPFNQVDPPERVFRVTVSQSIHKDLKLRTTDYSIDENGSITAETNFKEELEEQSYDALELIGEFKQLLQKTINILQEKALKVPGNSVNMRKLKEYEDMLQACEGWYEDELEIYE